MAEEPQQQKTDSKPTERVVLERINLTTNQMQDDRHAEAAVAWVEIGRATGTREQAVAEVAGDRKGHFRAPSLRSWKGIVEQAEPERPAIQRKLIDG